MIFQKKPFPLGGEGAEGSARAISVNLTRTYWNYSVDIKSRVIHEIPTHTDRQTDIQTHTHTQTHTHIDRHTEIHRETLRETERQTATHTVRQTYTLTYKDSQM